MCKQCGNLDAFHKDIDESDFSENEDLDLLEESDYYIEIQEQTEERLNKQRDEVLLAGLVWTIYNGLGKEVVDKLQYEELSKEDRKKLKDYIAGQATKKMDSILNNEYTYAIASYLLYVANFGGQSIFNQVGAETVFSFTSVAFQKIIIERVNLMGKGLDNTTAKRFAENILTGMQMGFNMEDLNTALKELGKDISADRARLIAVTETNSMLQLARQQVAKRLGVAYKIWHATEDEKTCKVCMDLDGEYIDINEAFNGIAMVAPIHCNCRCWVEFLFDGAIDIEALEEGSF